MEKIILGIDPGTNIMGYGLLKVVDGKAQMITMGVIDLRKFPDAYMKLGHIFERVTGIIDGYLPDEMAIVPKVRPSRQPSITVFPSMNMRP